MRFDRTIIMLRFSVTRGMLLIILFSPISQSTAADEAALDRPIRSIGWGR